MPAKSKKKTKTPKKSTQSKRQNSFWDNYVQQRDQFYQTHPWSRFLLGLLIISFAMAIGVLMYNKQVVYVGLTLDSQYGIRYPYVDTSYYPKR